MSSNMSPEDISNAASGHKANLSNPNTSEESKQHSREELKKLGGDDAFYSQDEPLGHEKNPGNVAGGLKATINQPEGKVSDEARQHAQEQLDQMKQ